MGSFHEARRFDVRRVCVIGAGPCGLAAAKYLVEQNAFEEIVVYEQQPEVGGVWYYTETPTSTLRVPQTNAYCDPDPPVRPHDGAPIFPTPMYDDLNTNIPKTLMQFSDLPFPEDSLVFPSRQVTQEYLLRYAQNVRHLIKISTQVVKVDLRQENGKDAWDVDVRCMLDGDETTKTFDAVLVANGHYSLTYIPCIKGIKGFDDAHPGIITHSKSFRRPAPFADKKVLVVGNGASGLDIATQVNRVAKGRVLLSAHTPTPEDGLALAGAEEVPEIEEFLVHERAVKFKDGRIENDIDAVILATGYLFSFPFFNFKPSSDRFCPALSPNGRQVSRLWQHLLDIRHPTMAFIGLPIKVIPYAVSESQAAIVARVWANELPLPPTKAMLEWEREELERRGEHVHVFPKLGDAEYVNRMHDRVCLLRTPGKVPPKWDDAMIWQRQTYVEARLKFDLGGRKATSWEEVGLVYKPPEAVADQR